MKIVVFGAGGVGGYFGGRLAQSDNDVTFIARGEHLIAIKRNGLKVKSINGDFVVHPNVTNDIAEVNHPDLIILGVKSWQISDVAKQIRPIVSDNTMVLPLQNGADNADKLRAVLDHKNVLVGLSKIISRIEAPGIIDHFAYDPEIVFAEYSNKPSDRTTQLKSVLDKAEIKNHVSNNIHLDIWKKYLFIATVSGIGALTRSTFGVTREDEQVRQIMYQTANEIVAIANAKGIALSNSDIELVMKVVDNLSYDATASMQRDIMDGRPSELENFNGYIVKQGKELHITTPVNSFIYNCLILQEKKNRGIN